MSQHNRDLVAKATALLPLDRRIAGIKFAYSEKEYEDMPARAMRANIAYCVAVKGAMAGRSVKLAGTFNSCSGSSRALGFAPPTADFTSGERYQKLGLYSDLPTCRQVAAGMVLQNRAAFGIMAQPLELYSEDRPDVVILVTDSRSVMRLLQGYTCIYGSQPVFKMTGNQAICIECTSHPLVMDQLNISMLCSGTRHLAKWKPHDIAIGLPYHRFAPTVEGLLKTADAVELDPAKRRIRKSLTDRGLPDPNFRFGYTYYTELAQQQGFSRKKQP